MRGPCPVCRGRGWIPDPSKHGPMSYFNPRTGSSWPEITCPNCKGEMFVGEPDVKNPLIPPDLITPLRNAKKV